MILHHIANRTSLIVKHSAALNSEILGHGDLHVFDMYAVQQWLQEGVCEPRKEHAVHWPLAKVMIDSKNVLLVEGSKQNRIQSAR